MTHTPVYLTEALEALDVRPGATYIDATLGEGGHFEQIVAAGGRVLGIDWDEDQVNARLAKTPNTDTVRVVQGNFADIARLATENGFSPADGILFDFGLSYGQLQKGGIGLSYKYHEEPLDMRLSAAAEMTAADILNRASEDELYDVFAKNAEEIHAREVARECVHWRKEYKFVQVGDFIDAVDRAIPANPQKSYARLFQGLRIEVNDEFGAIRAGLAGALQTLAPGGHMAILSFHSLEDRIVKRFIKAEDAAIAKSYKVLKKNGHKFERSALLRVIIKK